MKKIILLFFWPILSLAQSKTDTINQWNILVPKKLSNQDSLWKPCSVPGTVYSALYENQYIPNPLLAENESTVQWIEQEDFTFRTSFDVSDDVWMQEEIDLVFEGLDTYSQIFLNGKPIGKTENMFRSFRFPVKKELKKNQNELVIHFTSAVKMAQYLESKNGMKLPGDERVFVRKAQYQFGWDWGPRLVGCGIWKSVYLEGWQKARITTLSAQTKLNSNQDTAWITVSADIVSNKTDSAFYRFNLKENISFYNVDTSLYAEGKTLLHSGKNTIKRIIIVPNPKLWFPSTLGTETYHLSIQLDPQNTNSPFKTNLLGIRTIDLDTTNGAFTFVVNGTPIFITGANFIPESAFGINSIFDSCQNKLWRQQRLFQLDQAGINMIRIWGGGYYADEELLNYCDEQGIMVWQDFPFACGMYPGSFSFLENVRLEAEEQTQRMMIHPSMALWCGNNENYEGWFNWGWQKQYGYSEKDSLKIISDYQLLFQKLLPQLLKNNQDQTHYVHTSPEHGWGKKASMYDGDSHYWGVWWGMEPFEKYLEKVPRFMSEFGFQSLPSLTTWKKTLADTSLFWKSSGTKAHQKHPTGYETIETYLERDYPKPQKFEDWIYLSQLNQARGIGMAIQAQRLAAPRCMGSLFWQWNDCWPVSSWSAVDYFGEQKALYYDLVTLNHDNLLLVDTTQPNVSIIWNRKKPIKKYSFNEDLEISISLINSNGKTIGCWGKTIVQEEFNDLDSLDFNVEVFSFNTDTISGFNPSTCVLQLSILYPGCEDYIEYTRDFTFDRPKNLQLSQEKIKWKVVKCSFDECKHHYYLKACSQSFQKDVYFLDRNDVLNTLNQDQINISKNLPQFFSFMGEKTIYHGTKKEIKKLKRTLEIQTLNQLLAK
jgi:beta-mannosidase